MVYGNDSDTPSCLKEAPLPPHLPYVEVINWCSALARAEMPEIEVEMLPGHFVLGSWAPTPGDDIRAAAFEAFRHAKPGTFDGPAVRVVGYAASAGRLQLTVQRARYFDQCRSNLVLDYEHRGKDGVAVTLRHLLYREFGDALPPVNDCRMANTLGLAALILSRSGAETVPYLVSRSRDVAVFDTGDLWHCTASGAAEMQETGGNGRFYLAAMLKELHEEVGLTEGDLEMLMPVAFCRETTRRGKPQMFFVGVTHLDQAALRGKLQAARQRARAMGHVVENGARPLPITLDAACRDATLPCNPQYLAAEAAACLHYYGKCGSVAGGAFPSLG